MHTQVPVANHTGETPNQPQNRRESAKDQETDDQSKKQTDDSPQINNEPLRIMMADDDDDDRDFFSEVIKEINKDISLELARDGIELIEMLAAREKTLPLMIFLDLNMPRKSGRECLEEIRNNKTFKHINIIIYSTSSSQKDIDETFENGANLYIKKPSSYNELIDVARNVLSFNWDHYKPLASRNKYFYNPKNI